jgi:hypothetical protein
MPLGRAKVLERPRDLARAQLAYGIGLRRGLEMHRALKLAVAVGSFHSPALVPRAHELLRETLGELPVPRRGAAETLVSECLDGEGGGGGLVPLLRLAQVLPALVAGEGQDNLRRLDRLAAVWGPACQILEEAGERRGLVRLHSLLEESRTMVGALTMEGEECWAPLGVLQDCLEREARDLARRAGKRKAA